MSEPGLFCQINTAATGPAETAKKHVRKKKEQVIIVLNVIGITTLKNVMMIMMIPPIKLPIKKDFLPCFVLLINVG